MLKCSFIEKLGKKVLHLIKFYVKLYFTFSLDGREQDFLLHERDLVEVPSENVK